MPVIALSEEYEPPPPGSCAGCGGRICDRYYLQAVDRQWHVTCLTCCQCKTPLDSERTCFAKDGHIYCKEDYYRLFAVKRCARCQSGIFANELVMRARDLVFHLHCFTCTWCNAALTQGDYFGLRDDLVYCKTHYELIVRGDSLFAAGQLAEEPLGYSTGLLPHLSPLLHGEPVGAATGAEHGGLLADRSPLGDGSNFAAFAPLAAGKKGRPRKRKNVDLDGSAVGLSPIDTAGCALQLDGIASQGSPPLTGSGHGNQRTKRMRTSFKHHQLRTMKSYFAINQNPDAKDLKQLAQKTGLSKRVLQVWFQNARAKWRRNNLKQQDSHLMSSEPGSGIQQLHSGPHGHMTGMSSPGATSSFSEPSPVPSCGGIPSDGPMPASQQSMDFDSSNPMTPLLSSHHSMVSSHNGDPPPLHINSFHEMF